MVQRGINLKLKEAYSEVMKQDGQLLQEYFDDCEIRDLAKKIESKIEKGFLPNLRESKQLIKGIRQLFNKIHPMAELMEARIEAAFAHDRIYPKHVKTKKMCQLRSIADRKELYFKL